MGKRLCQSDPAWADDFVGLSTVTRFSAAACLLTEMAEACRELGIDPSATPASVQAKALAAWRAAGAKQSTMPFIKLPIDERVGRQPGANAVTVDVGAANGLKIGPRLDAAVVGIKGLVDAFDAAVASGGLAFAHLDTDATDADFNGKHWGLLLCRLEGVITYSDPAIGDVASLQAATLTGPTRWKKPRTFAVRGLRTVHRL